ncbi:MAG: glycosyltransferase family 4 protein [Dehalococcoidales bacterium]|nr:glycosyltransferase family 4 protein [Dehalococcoidales bacterium]
MKILIIQDTDWIRRNPVQHTHLAERLALRGHKIRVIDYEILWQTEGKRSLFSRRQVFSVSRILKDANITVIRPGILKFRLLDYFSMLFTYSREIGRQLRDFAPDVVVTDCILSSYLAVRAARKKRIPVIFYSIDIVHRLVPFKLLQPLGRILEARNIRNADLVIAINEGLREYTVRMGAATEKTLVIRAGIDSETYNPGIDGTEIRRQYGIKEGDFVLLFVGWLYHFSGLKEAARQLAEIKNKHIKLLIVGDGDAYSEIQRVRNEKDLTDQIIMAGRQPYEDIPKYIAASDVCLMPAYNNEIMRDIVPIKMYEYMAMQKPVIATRLPGIVKEFGDDNGIVYIERPEDAIARAIELADNGDLPGLGLKAWRFVANNSWESITDQFEAVLNKVTEGRQHGRISEGI